MSENKRPVSFHQIGNHVYFDEILNMKHGDRLSFDELIQDNSFVVIEKVWLITQDSPSIVYPVDKMAPIYRPFGWHGHVGVDWIIVPGTPVPSIKDGEVIESAQDSKTYGGYLIVKHADDHASLYAHLSKLMVKKGDVVKSGDIIGLSGGVPGTPGAGASTGYHLHFEIRVPGHLDSNKFNVDPIPYLET